MIKDHYEKKSVIIAGLDSHMDLLIEIELTGVNKEEEDQTTQSINIYGFKDSMHFF